MSQHRVCNIDYDNELNQRMNQRYFPSKELQPNFDPRPVSTKYTLYHTNDSPPNTNEELRRYPEFQPQYTFYPGNAKAPVQHALKTVDTESLLRNQYMALQKNDHAYYIPPLESDLYNTRSNIKEKPKKEELLNPISGISNTMSGCQEKLAPNTFQNSTRHNLIKNFS